MRPRGRSKLLAWAVAPLVFAGALVLSQVEVHQGVAQPAATGSSCFGEISADGVPQRPGRLLRFGITPRVQAGQVGGGPASAVPERPVETLRALARLRPREGPFVVRLNRLFFSEGDAGIREFERLRDRYTSRGYLSELQLRYHPSESQEGDMRAWVAYVREER